MKAASPIRAEFKEGCYLEALYARCARHWTPCVLHALLDFAPAVIDAKDRRARYLFTNRAFESIYGASIEAAAGRTDAELFSQEQATVMARMDQRVLESGQPETFEESLRQLDGDHNYLVHKFPIHDPREDLPIAVGTLRVEITERKAMEQRLAQRSAEMRVAQRIQQQLLPTRMPEVPGFQVAASCMPAQETGGDYLDFLQLPNQQMGLVIADASGHGVGAALLMAQTRAYVHAVSRLTCAAGAILTGVNEFLVQDMPEGHFVTMFLGVLDPDSRRLGFASAGHLPALVFDAAGELRERLECTDPPLGVHAALSFPAGQAVTLQPGDTLVLLTDGIIDAFGADGVPYGWKRLFRELRGLLPGSPDQIVRSILNSIRDFARGRQHDDCSILVVQSDQSCAPSSRLLR